jgi:hypothetical protein
MPRERHVHPEATFRRVQGLIKEGEFMNYGGQRNQVEDIIRLVDQPSFIESVQGLNLLGRRIFWNSIVSIVSWQGFDRRFHSFFSRIWSAIINIDSEIFDGRCISNMLNSVSKSQLQTKQSIIKALASKIHPHLDMDGQGLANSLNALSKLDDLNQLEVKSATICLASKINPRLAMNAQEVANSLNALSKLSDNTEVKSAIICLAMKINSRLVINAQEVAHSLNALSKLSDLNQTEVKSAIICLAMKIDSRLVMNGQNVANSLNALSKLNDLNQSEVNSAIICLAMKIDSMLELDGQDVANSLDALGIANVRSEATLVSLLDRISSLDVNDVSFHACLIYSFYLWVDFQMTDSLSMKFSSIQELQHIDSNLLYALMGSTMNPALSEAAVKCLPCFADERYSAYF